MKIRTIIITSAVTTLFVLGIVVAALATANPGMAQVLPIRQAPSLESAHLALPDGGGERVWNLLGGDFSDVAPGQDRAIAFGCLYYEPGSTTPWAIATLNLPDGATMTRIRFYWRDWVDTYNVSLDLRKYYYDGTSHIFTYDLLLPAPLESNGTAALHKESYTEAFINIPVSNANGFYAVYANLEYAENDQKLCGVEIGYTLPGIFGSAMPIISK